MNAKVEKIGSGYYTEDAEYVVKVIGGVYAVVRGDGSHTTLSSEEEAHEAASRLAAGEADDKDYEWVE